MPNRVNCGGAAGAGGIKFIQDDPVFLVDFPFAFCFAGQRAGGLVVVALK